MYQSFYVDYLDTAETHVELLTTQYPIHIEILPCLGSTEKMATLSTLVNLHMIYRSVNIYYARPDMLFNCMEMLYSKFVYLCFNENNKMFMNDRNQTTSLHFLGLDGERKSPDISPLQSSH